MLPLLFLQYDANASGVRAGQNYMNRIISNCSQPVPRPTRTVSRLTHSTLHVDALAAAHVAAETLTVESGSHRT